MTSETAQRRAAAWTRVLAGPPQPVTPFLDRQAEQEALRRLLAPGGARPGPVVLQGPAGVGTTTLAAHLVGQLAPQFPGGIIWADLTTVNGDPWPILVAWPRMLGLIADYPPDPTQRVRNVRRALAGHVQARGPILAILDDARAIWVDGIHLLIRILPDAATPVLTSSEPAVAAMLGGEALPVAPWPKGTSTQLLAALSDGVLTGPLADAVARYAGGVPLALFLVARAAALDSAPTVLARLRDPGPWFDVLREASRTADDAISRCLAANYATLEARAPADARLWRWLGAFAPGVFSVAEVAGVLAAAGHIPPDESPTDAVGAALQRLADRGLVEPAPGWGYRLHPRLYLSAAALLDYAGETAAAQHAHRTSYLAYILARRSRFDELETVRTNLLLGMDRAVEAVDYAAVRGYAWALSSTRRNNVRRTLPGEEGFLWRHGYWHELRRRLEQARWAAEVAGEDWDVAAFAGNLAILLQELGERESARRELERVRDTFHRLGDTTQEIVALDQLSQLAQSSGDDEAAREYQRQAQALRQRL